MSKRNYLMLPILFVVCAIWTPAQEKPDNFPVLNGPYLGQEPPGITPKIFAPGLVSKKNRYELMTAFSPDGKEFYYTVTKKKWSDFRIWHTKYESNKWTAFRMIPASLSISTFGPVYSPTNDTLFFGSPNWYSSTTNILYCSLNQGSWSEPRPLGAPINSQYNEWQFSIARDNTMVFTSNRPGGKGDYDLYISEMVNHTYQKPVNLIHLNSEEDEYSVFISPDKTYIIFSSQHKQGYGWDDLYISFRRDDLTWSNPINFGPEINTKHAEFSPHVSPDGKFLFFSKWDADSQWSDIYWVDAKIIEYIRSKKYH